MSRKNKVLPDQPETSPIRLHLFDWVPGQDASAFFLDLMAHAKCSKGNEAHHNLMAGIAYMAGKVKGYELAIEAIKREKPQ